METSASRSTGQLDEVQIGDSAALADVESQSGRCKWIVPEVVQTSAMDCGPAALISLLGGFGIRASYTALREACNVELDGTSLDHLESIALELGLRAEVTLVPRDHLLLPRRITSLAVMNMPGGYAHFVVVWRRHGAWVQVMDPSVGRRWLRAEQLSRSLSGHVMNASVDALRAHVASTSFREALGLRLHRIGHSPSVADALIDAGLNAHDVRSLGALDAAARMVESIAQARGVARGPASARLMERLRDRALATPPGPGEPIHPIHWTVRPHPSGDPDQVLVRGAAVLRVSGVTRLAVSPAIRVSSSLPSSSSAGGWQAASLAPVVELLRVARLEGRLPPAVVACALVLTASLTVLESLLLKALLYVTRYLGLLEQRYGAMAFLGVFFVLLMLAETQLAGASLRMGRRLDSRLRLALFEKLSALPDRYFRSRLASDMAERSHAAAALRTGPPVLARLVRLGTQCAATVVAIAWLDPASLPLASAVALVSLGVPMLANRLASERDLRVQTHAGALSRFYLDALIGQLAIRAHSAERAIRRVHEQLLTEWARAGFSLQRVAVAVEGVTSFLGFALTSMMLLGHVRRTGVGGDVLLLAHWALSLPAFGNEFAIVARQLPFLRNLAMRSLEPIVAAGDDVAAVALHSAASGRGIALRFESVTVEAAGRALLLGLDFSVPPGSHVAIVGSSGAGKSSLLGLLLGFQRATTGRILIDGEPLTDARVQGLRRELAWLDPGITLWNQSLLDNIGYAAPTALGGNVGRLIERARLRGVVETLPDGLVTALGEGGGLISGGEGQRVRFARALTRPQARLVLLDEPFRGLDRSTRADLLAEARASWAHSTLLCVTHDIGETASFDRVLVVEDGRIVEDGAPAALRARDSRYARMLAEHGGLQERLGERFKWRTISLQGGRLRDVERSS